MKDDQLWGWGKHLLGFPNYRMHKNIHLFYMYYYFNKRQHLREMKGFGIQPNVLVPFIVKRCFCFIIHGVCGVVEWFAGIWVSDTRLKALFIFFQCLYCKYKHYKISCWCCNVSGFGNRSAVNLITCIWVYI